MAAIHHLLINIAHRPWPLPKGKWEYYQEWNNALFLHWEVPLDSLAKLVPHDLTLDSFDGKYYVSLVAFTMQHIRSRNLPSIKFISDFHEINIRTYINHNGKRGVFFLNIEAEKPLSAWIARNLSGLPYMKSRIERSENKYVSTNSKNNFKLHAAYGIGDTLTAKSDLDKWLTERYCLYMEDKSQLYRYDIHHSEWELNHLRIEALELNYRLGQINLNTANLKKCHYSKGVSLVSWPKEKVQ